MTMEGFVSNLAINQPLGDRLTAIVVLQIFYKHRVVPEPRSGARNDDEGLKIPCLIEQVLGTGAPPHASRSPLPHTEAGKPARSNR